MFRRLLITSGSVLALLVAAAAPAMASDYSGHVHALVMYHAWDYPQVYVNGYCDVGYHPTGDEPFNVEATSEDWTAASYSVSGNVQVFYITHPQVTATGYDFVDFDFTCTSD